MQTCSMVVDFILMWYYGDRRAGVDINRDRTPNW